MGRTVFFRLFFFLFFFIFEIHNWTTYLYLFPIFSTTGRALQSNSFTIEFREADIRIRNLFSRLHKLESGYQRAWQRKFESTNKHGKRNKTTPLWRFWIEKSRELFACTHVLTSRSITCRGRMAQPFSSPKRSLQNKSRRAMALKISPKKNDCGGTHCRQVSGERMRQTLLCLLAYETKFPGKNKKCETLRKFTLA